MQVILLDKMANLGTLGDQVTVKSGYARNFLIPQKKAVMATKSNIEHFEARRSELEAQANDALIKAQARASKVAAMEIVVIQSKAGEAGKLFGSVGTRDIAEALNHIDTNLAVDSSEVRLPQGALRQLGDYEIAIHLHPDVAETLKLRIDPTE